VRRWRPWGSKSGVSSGRGRESGIGTGAWERVKNAPLFVSLSLSLSAHDARQLDDGEEEEEEEGWWWDSMSLPPMSQEEGEISRMLPMTRFGGSGMFSVS